LSSSSERGRFARVVDLGGDLETVLHITPLVIGTWRRGERFLVRPGEQSFYWRRLFSADGRASRIEDAMERGESADAGERDYLLGCLKELLFESVRARVDPSLPSRSECMFLFERSTDARDYGSRLGRDAHEYTLLELRPLHGARLFRARRSSLDVPAFVPDIVAAAEEYWRGLPRDAPGAEAEVLFTGAFEIVRVVSAGAGPRLTIEGKTFADIFRSRAGVGALAVHDGRNR
jgi:hypothetical protein